VRKDLAVEKVLDRAAAAAAAAAAALGGGGRG